VLAPLVFTVRDTRTRAKASAIEPGAAKAFLKSHARMLVPYYAGFGMTAVAVYALSSWVPAYMARSFDLTMAEVGLGFGLTMFLATGTGQILWSMVVDRLYARGVADAHLRFHMFTWLVSLPAVIAAMLVDSPLAFLILLGVFYLFTFPFQGYSIAGLQLVTPAQFRGRQSAAYLTYLNLAGLALGPTLVGALTDFVFRDPQKLGWAMALVVAVSAPLGMLLLWIAAREKRALAAASEPNAS
jgi:MFS family permease